MASGPLSRGEALQLAGCRHACHLMLYCDTHRQLFGRIPIRHIILMQMRFDGLLGFPGGFVDLSKETLEEGLVRELSEELGVAVPVSVDHHVESRYATRPSSPRLITHFYVKKMTEEQILEVEKASVCTAKDHGQEVLGMVRVPLYSTKGGGGLSMFLSHSFIGNARSQLLDTLRHLNMVSPEELQQALQTSLKTQQESREKLQAELTAIEREPEEPTA
ncbi:U8 snoRNA-decapping enzyme [Synchiropus splendidus]|uniref:U8 snoRNA-decapping enzyme n=1 Tax=Synchiropus splendidus TaxID=270530 RepID=UPI00237E0EFF|nr:U8 snoRNA-decapping enzyme [Synchiropus splendidus]